MANRTVGQTITTTWVQIADGTQTKTIQVISGIILLADSDEWPAPNATGFVIRDWITVTPPNKAWIRSAGASANIIS